MRVLLLVSIAVAGAGAGAASVAATGANAQQSLDSKAALSWYSGVTVEGTTADGSSIRVYHSPSG